MKRLNLITFLLLLFSFRSFAAAPITGDSIVCAGATTQLTDNTPGGAWSSSDTFIAKAYTSGVVLGVSAGTVTITYSVGASYTTTTVLVHPAPDPINNFGVDTFCTGGTVTLYDSAAGGGVWTCDPVFSILDTTANSAIVYGYGSGHAYVRFTDTLGCTADVGIFVFPSPNPIVGINYTFVDSTTTLSGEIGGTWGTMNTAIATVGATTGIVTGISAGSTTIYCKTFCGDVPIVLTVLRSVSVPIEDATSKSKIEVYPNPVGAALTIIGDRINEIAVTNLMGQVVYAGEYNAEKVQVDVSGLPTGVYLVRINGTDVRKFVKE